MVNKPLIRPYLLGGVALGGVARIPMIHLPGRVTSNEAPCVGRNWDAAPLGVSCRFGHFGMVSLV